MNFSSIAPLAFVVAALSSGGALAMVMFYYTFNTNVLPRYCRVNPVYRNICLHSIGIHIRTENATLVTNRREIRKRT